jgi:hypothetical protein
MSVLSVMLAASGLCAQSPSDPPASREDVLKLFDTMHLRQQMTLALDSTLKQQRTMVHDALKKRFPEVTEEELARRDQLMADMMKDFPIDAMLDDMIPVYQRHLTHGDVEAMNVFYGTPTGQKILREMPAMTAESMQAASPRIQAMMDKAMDQADQMVKEDHNKKSAPPKPGTDKN